MTTGRMSRVLGELRRTALLYDHGSLTDGELLDLFVTRGDEEAFAALVRRHGPVVLAVCRRVVGNLHDAEDAFQATFLVLARKAPTVRPRERVGGWLCGVAHRTALKTRAAAARRRLVEQRAGRAEGVISDPAPDDLRPLVDEELRRLPGKYGTALILCLLEGRTRKEAARQLGWSEGTLSGRLARAKALLRARLAQARRHPVRGGVGRAAGPRDGVGVGAAPRLTATVGAAAASGRAVGVSVTVLSLTEEVMRAMFLSKCKVAAAVVLAVGLAVGGGWLAYPFKAEAGDQPAARPSQPAPAIARVPDRPAPYVIEPPDILRVDFSSEGKTRSAEHLVRPDGSLGLGLFGEVMVTGKTLDQARLEIARQLARFNQDKIDPDSVKVEVVAFNSKFYYISRLDSGEVIRIPLTGNETVQDALGQSGVPPPAEGMINRIWLERPTGARGEPQTLPVDWPGITKRGETATNYQLLPGDRLCIKAESIKPAATAKDQAAADLRVAEYYRTAGHPDSATFAYELVQRRHPKTAAAETARQRWLSCAGDGPGPGRRGSPSSATCGRRRK